MEYSSASRMRGDWQSNTPADTSADGPMVTKMKEMKQRAMEKWNALTKGKSSDEQQYTERQLLARLADLTGEQYLKESKTKKIELTLEPDVGLGFEVMYRKGQRGVVACNVTRGGPAEEAGIMPGFIIVSVNGCNTLGVDVEAVRAMLLPAGGTSIVGDSSAADSDAGADPDADADAATVTEEQQQQQQQQIIETCRSIMIVVASPLLAMDGSAGAEGKQTGTLAKAPSYVNVKQTLIKEFGEEAFQRSKKEVQSRMAAIAQEVEPWYEQPKELTKQEIMMEQMEAHAAIASEKMKHASEKASEKMKQAGEKAGEKMKQAGKWLHERKAECLEAAELLSNDLGGAPVHAQTPEEIAEENLAAEVKAATSDSQLQARVKAFGSGAEEPPLVCQSVFGSGTGVSLSYAGVRSFLITEYGDETFARNKAWVRRELQSLDAAQKPTVTIGDILGGSA